MPRSPFGTRRARERLSSRQAREDPVKATRFSRLAALILALAALGLTAGSAGATDGDDGQSAEATKEQSEKAGGEDKGKDEAKAEAKAAVKAQAETEKKAEAEARAAAKAQAKATIAANFAAKAQAKAAAKAAAEAQKNAEKAARAQAKAAAKAAATAEAKAAGKADAKVEVKTNAQSQSNVTTSTPNQGEASKVLTVTGASCATTLVAGAKVEGGLGTTVRLSSSLPIVKVTLKSGNGAAVVASSFSADFKSATITLSKDVSNYVVWTCGAAGTQTPVQTHTPTASVPNQGEASKVLTVTGASCVTTLVAGAKVEGGLGTTVRLSSSLPIVKVTLKSGEGATVVASSFSADFKTATITLSKDISNYVVWTCGAAAVTTQTTTTTGGETKTETKTEVKSEVKTGVKGDTKTEVTAGTKTETSVAAKPAVAGQAKGKAAAPGQAAANEAQPSSSGVLGAVASAPGDVAGTATATIPFTGVPLWIAALLGFALLAGGLALRRGSANA